MKKAIVVAITCLLLTPVEGISQTHRRVPPRKTPTTSFEQKQQAELRAGREQIAAQIKTLTQFIFLFGGISKSIETAEQVSRNKEDTSVGMTPDRIAQNKSKLKESLGSVRTGLDKLESSFRLNPVLQKYYPNLSGVSKLAQTAETQLASSSYDLAGRSLVGAINKLADALVILQ